MIKTCHKRSFLVLLLFNLGILETKHKCTKLLSTDLACIFHYFFSFCFNLEKRDTLFSEIFVYT